MASDTKRKSKFEVLSQLRLFDDTFMSIAFNDQIKETKFLIDTITGMNVTVIETKTQDFIPNLLKHEARLDIFARDSDGRVYHFEIQRARDGATEKRARFTAAVVDTKLLEKGEDYTGLPDRYTIFITETDFFGKGLPLYHVGNKIEELDNEPFDDGGHIIYVNGAYRDTNNPIGALMHDFSCVNPSDMINEVLRDRVRELKEETGGRKTMCAIVDNLIKDGIKEDRLENAKKMIADGSIPIEKIAYLQGLPLSEVQKLAEEMKNQPKAE